MIYIHVIMIRIKETIIAILVLSSFINVDAQTPKVLLIGIDGCRPDALQAASTPNMDALISNATYSYDALNEGITFSGPGWSSLLTGVWPDKHGVTDNSFAGSDFPSYPHLFQRIEEHDPSLHTVSISQWHPVNNSIATGVADVTINVDDHTDYVETAAVDYLSNEDPDAIFVHFDDVDHAGHGYGFSEDVTEYIESIEAVDAAIGTMVQSIVARPSYADEDWVIIISTDHGGIGTSHGGNTIDERNIFLIVSGDGIENQEIAAPSSWVDVPPVTNCLGDSTELYFDGDAYGEVTSSMLFDFGSDVDFTIECRVRTTESGDVAILTDKDWDSGFNPGWVFSFNINGGPWKVNVGDGTDRVDVEGNDISDGEWHTLSATFDRDGMLTIYEDGIMVNEASMAALGDISTGNGVFMGADVDQDYGYSGYLAETRIFAQLVSPTVIEDWACSRLDFSHPNYGYLVAQWAMNDGVGNGLMNDGANAIATSISGAVWESTSDTSQVLMTDYSGTPRQVDFMVSALEHLCIPVQEAWDLDGVFVGTSCEPNSISELERSDVNVYAGESEGILIIQAERPGVITVYDIRGAQILQASFRAGHTYVQVDDPSQAIYLYNLTDQDLGSRSGKIYLWGE